MKLNSLALRSNMIFAKFNADIIERESYIVVKTLNNPTYHWGNFIIFKKAPVDGDFINWMNIFEKEMTHYKELGHYLFIWDELIEPKTVEYLAHGFELQKSVSLLTGTLNPPKYTNGDVLIRPLATAKEWSEADELQILTRDEWFSYEEYKEFKTAQSANYQKLIANKQGNRFGAFLDGKIVADLGIYFEGDLGRYQNVVTHPDYRGRGICGTLVYESGMYALKNWGVKKLAMEADPDYHAARIYESVGFAPIENSYALYWCKSKN